MIHHVKQNDRRPAPSTVLKRGEVIVDLTTATSVTFHMREFGRVEDKVDSAATIVGAPTLGAVEYQWAVGDTDIAVNYRAAWTVLWADGTEETFPTVSFDVVAVGSNLGA